MKPDLINRITDYLCKGGLFNPEMMEHNKVRDLLIDCREILIENAIIEEHFSWPYERHSAN